MKYIPGLNGLRALAVIFVVFTHWGPPPIPGFHVVERFMPDGKFGVDLFFVLSGFLISSILFIEKNRLSDTHTARTVIIHFYIRRFLRIFPIYYLTLAVVYASNIPGFRMNILYYLSYTENFHVFFRRSWDVFAHTWSLAVEEQFYLIWPFIIIFLNRSQIFKALILFILLGPLCSFLQTYILKNGYNEYVLTPTCFDSFGIGALLAYYYSEDKLEGIKKWIKILLPLSIVLFFYWKLAPDGGHFQFLRRFFSSIIACAAILFCLSKKYVRTRDKLLENKILSQLGIVSYGIYLFHYAFPYFYYSVKLHFGYFNHDPTSLTDYFAMVVILLIVSFTSYYCFEKPILSLKRRFKY